MTINITSICLLMSLYPIIEEMAHSFFRWLTPIYSLCDLQESIVFNIDNFSIMWIDFFTIFRACVKLR